MCRRILCQILLNAVPHETVMLNSGCLLIAQAADLQYCGIQPSQTFCKSLRDRFEQPTAHAHTHSQIHREVSNLYRTGNCGDIIAAAQAKAENMTVALSFFQQLALRTAQRPSVTATGLKRFAGRDCVLHRSRTGQCRHLRVMPPIYMGRRSSKIATRKARLLPTTWRACKSLVALRARLNACRTAKMPANPSFMAKLAS